MAPPLLVVTPTKGHVGWDEPVRDSVQAIEWSTPALQRQEPCGQPGNRTRV